MHESVNFVSYCSFVHMPAPYPLRCYVLLVLRRTNELKSEIDIPDDVVKKFEQFWSDFKNTPLKGTTWHP